MARLFIAIDFPPPIEERIGNICYGVTGARWVPAEQIHLTLRFLGDIDDPTYHQIVNALDRVRCEPFQLRLSGTGYFPPRGRPKVLWIGVEEQPLLMHLHGEIEAALASVGVERERRKFHPHVTVARLRERVRPADVTPFLSATGAFSAGPVTISAFHLYSSQLRREGAIHRIEAGYTLGEGGGPA
jgi:2'-5' RNA ligase